MSNIKIAVLICSMFLLFSCASPIYEASFNINAKITEEQKMEAINNTLVEFGWTASFPKKGVYRIHIKKKEHKAVFDVICKKSSCFTKYVGSKNLKYNASKHTIHSNYNKWVKTFMTHFIERLKLYQ